MSSGRDERLPFLDLGPGPDAADVREAIERVIARGWFVLGPEVEAFEAEFATAAKARHADRRMHCRERVMVCPR